MKMNPIKIDKMRYQVNALGHMLVFLSLVFSIIALFTLITYDNYATAPIPSQRIIPDFQIAIEIAIGIVTMLATFLCAEKVKFYDWKWSYIGVFVLAAINLYRATYFPKYCFEKGWVPESIYQSTEIMFYLAGVILIIAGLVSSAKVYLLSKHTLKETR